MYTTFHFSNPNEISNDFLEKIKTSFKGKSIVVTIEEQEYVPTWQKEEVLKKVEECLKNPEKNLISFEDMIKELRNEQ